MKLVFLLVFFHSSTEKQYAPSTSGDGLEIDQLCYDHETCGFAGLCSFINGKVVCTINIWTPFALLFIVIFIVLIFVTILLYVDHRKRKSKWLSENAYCNVETDRRYTSIVGNVGESNYQSLIHDSTHMYSTISLKDLNERKPKDGKKCFPSKL